MLLMIQPTIPEKKKKETHLQHQLIFTNSPHRPWLTIPSSGKSTPPVSKIAQGQGNIPQLFFLISLILCCLCFPDPLTTFPTHNQHSTQCFGAGFQVGVKSLDEYTRNHHQTMTVRLLKCQHTSGHGFGPATPTSPCLLYSAMQGSLMDWD